MELKNKKINFLGDSITEGAGVADPKNIYLNVIAEKTGAFVRNYGVSGTRIARKTVPSECLRFDEDFVMRAEKMDPDADIIVVFGGTNDYDHGDAKLGTMSDRTVYTFYGAMHILLESLINKYPEAQIAVMTPLHKLDEKLPVNKAGVKWDIELSGIVEAEKRVAEYYSVPVLDLYAVSGMQPSVGILREKYMPDGLHPNDAGHKKIADKLINFLKLM